MTHAFLKLETGKVIDRYQFTERPMTQKLIDRVEELASNSPHRSLTFQPRYNDGEDNEKSPEEDDVSGMGQPHRIANLNYPGILLGDNEDDAEEVEESVLSIKEDDLEDKENDSSSAREGSTNDNGDRIGVGEDTPPPHHTARGK